MRNAFKISIATALLTLSACSPPIFDEVVMVEEPAALGAPAAPVESKLSCDTEALDDGIGGTGCHTPIE